MRKYFISFYKMCFVMILIFCSREVSGQIYLHDFGTSAITSHPYTVTPTTIDPNLSASSWSNSTSTWTSFAGNTGQAIALNNSSGTPTITLKFNIASNHKLSITDFSFWRQRSSTGSSNWSMTINGIAVGSGTIPTAGATVSKTTVANPVVDLTGTVTVVLSLSGASGTGTFRLDDFTLYGSVTQAGKTSNCTVCSWNDPNAWVPVGVPAATDIVTIRPTDLIYNPNANLLRSAATNVNGNFQIETGSSVDTSSQDFKYGTSGTLIFNTSGSYGVNGNDKFWPFTNGPVNVKVLQGGFNLNAGTTRTITGNLDTAAGIGISAGENLTLNGVTSINPNGFFSSTPTFGPLSTLVYKNQTVYNVGNEWTGNAGTAGKGVPQNVNLISSVLNFPNFDHGLAGNLNIDTGSTLNLNGSAGDLYLAGNWTKAGIFNPNNRAVFFKGSTVQTLSGETVFDYLTLDNPAGVTLSNKVVNNFTVNLVNGKLSLGASDLVLGSTGTIVNAGAAKYVVTNGAGQLKRTVASAASLFPVGNATYNPITFTNSGIADVYGVRVADATPAGPNPNKAVNRLWITTEAAAGGSNLAVAAQYNTGEKGTAFDAGTDPFIGFFDGSTYTQQVAATISGSNPFVATSNTNLNPADLTTGTKYFAIGKDNAFVSVATKLVFKSVPSSGIVGNNLAVFTVEAQDVYNNVVKNFAGDIVIAKVTGSGNISGTLTKAAVAGVATFNNIQFDAADTYTIRATSGSLMAAVSGNILISPNPANAYFRSKGGGNWTTPGTWESSDDGNTNWVAATVTPTFAANTITIRNGNNVTINSSVTVDQLVIANGGQVTFYSGTTSSPNKLIINDGQALDFNIETGGIFQVTGTGKYAESIFFGGNSSMMVGGKVIIGNGTQTNGSGFQMFAAEPQTQVIWKNGAVFEWNSTGLFSANDQIFFPDVSSSTIPVFRVSTLPNSPLGGADDVIFNGLFQITGINVRWQGNGKRTFRNGITAIGAGNMSADPGAGTGIWEIGDKTESATAELGGATGNLTLTNANGISIVAACYATLTSNVNLGTNTKFYVQSGGTLDFGFNGNTALNILGSSSGQKFSTQGGSVLKITSPYGITKTAAGAAAGNVQVPVGSRSFGPGTIYHYIGKENQSTGDGLPEGLTNKIIVDLETDATLENLNFTSAGITKLNSTGTLEIRRGNVIDAPGSGFRNNVVENDDGETDAQKGNILMTGGRYVVSGSGTKPSLSGTYTLNAGTIEFAGTAATKIRTSSPPKQYFNVEVSGNNVESGGKNFVVNNVLKVTNAGIFTVPEETDSANPYAVTAKKGIQVAPGAQALFLNNANLLQEIDAANYGKIKMLRKAGVPSNQYNYWASPVIGQQLYNLYDVPVNSVMTYNSWNDKFTILPTSSNPTSVFGKGYSIKGSPTLAPALTAEFLGVPNNETSAGQYITLSTAGNNYNLIGNPFPSNLDILALYAGNLSKFYNAADESPTLYFWDNTSNTDTSQQGSAYVNQNYAMLNLPGGTGVPAPRLGTSGKKPTGIVKPGQGFIMRAAETGGDLVFRNSFRTSLSGANGTYFKGAAETKDTYWLSLTTPSTMNITIAVAYNPEAQNMFEPFDSTIFNEAVTENFYSLSSDSKKLAIQTRKGDFTTSDVLALGIKTSNSGTHKISIDEKEGIFEMQPIYLKDNLLNIITDLTLTAYEFTSSPGVNENRFEILYEPRTVLETDTRSPSGLQVYRNGENFVIRSTEDKISDVELYDVSGRLMKKIPGNALQVTVDAAYIVSGLYILKIPVGDKIFTRKIVK